MFEKGNRITTNGISCFEVIDSNEDDVVCKDLLTEDFMIFSKSEHLFENANIKNILINSLKEILNDTDTSQNERDFILNSMNICIEKLV